MFKEGNFVTVILRQWGVLQDNKVLSTELIMYISHLKEFLKHLPPKQPTSPLYFLNPFISFPFFPSPPRYTSRSLSLSSIFLVCHSILEFQNIFEQRRISEKKKKCMYCWLGVRTRFSLPYLLVCSGSAATSVVWWCKIFSPEQINFSPVECTS